MTGRELIMYILENGLENEDVFKGGRPAGFMTLQEAAVKFGVGASTVNAWISLDKLDYVSIGGMLYIPGNAKSPYG